MAITIRKVVSTADKKAFVQLPFTLYKGHQYWVPPMKSDELKALSPETNPAFEFCQVEFWLAIKDGRVVGRIGAIINELYNKKTGVKYGRFNRLECIDDKQVLESLMNTAEKWMKEREAEIIHGPLGFSNLDTQGLLVEGFDHLPSIASVYHFPYYHKMLEELGYEKENDWVEFRLTLSEQAVNKASRGVEIIKKRGGFNTVPIGSKSELKKYAKTIFEILNDAFSDLPYVAELNASMIDMYIAKYFSILDPRFMTLVEKDGELVGFFIGLPSLSEAMQKAGGKLFPFGFWHIMKALKNPQVIDMMLTGVRKEYHSAGVAVILIGELQRKMMEIGINQMETTGVFETNSNVISNWKNYDHIQHKRKRCYMKVLSS